MRTIYLDEMFLLNLVIDYFIILATAKLCALPLRRGRFALAAALGALGAVLPLFPIFAFLAHPIMKAALGAAIVLAAFGTLKRFWRLCLAFFAVSAALGGAVYAASLLSGGVPEGGVYTPVSMRVLILSFAVCYVGLTLLFKRLGRRQKRQTLTVSLTLCGRSAAFTALRDTGNELYDPMSGLPVIIAAPEAAGGILDAAELEALRAGSTNFMSTIVGNSLLCHRFWLVPCGTVTGASLLPVFRPDALVIGGKSVKNVLVALTSTTLCRDGEFSAII